MVVIVRCDLFGAQQLLSREEVDHTIYLLFENMALCPPPKFDIFFSNSSKRFTFHLFCPRFDILVDNTVSKFYSESVTLHVIRHSSLLVSCKFLFFIFRHGGSSEMVISHRRFAENGKETYRNKKSTCKRACRALIWVH